MNYRVFQYKFSVRGKVDSGKLFHRYTPSTGLDEHNRFT